MLGLKALMDFSDRIQDLAKRIPRQLESVSTEEATKHAFVLPFISALGYDVFDPSEVTPELIADVGIKKGEKVDYAILREGKPAMIFECKAHSTNLDTAHFSQLHRYFHVTDTRFAVLTNGVVYRFFTDLEQANKMDSKPFFEINLLDLKESSLDELKKFTKSQFDVTNILNTASELKYVRELKRHLADELQVPSDEFARLFISRLHEGVITAKVRAQYTPFITKAWNELLGEIFNDRLKHVIGQPNRSATTISDATSEEAAVLPDEEAGDQSDSGKDIETTADEIQGFMIIRAVAAAVVDVQRVVMRDVQSYCGVLLDDNNRKPLCRLYLSGKKWQVGLFHTEDRKEIRFPLNNLSDLYQHADKIRTTIERYDAKVESA